MREDKTIPNFLFLFYFSSPPVSLKGVKGGEHGSIGIPLTISYSAYSVSEFHYILWISGYLISVP